VGVDLLGLLRAQRCGLLRQVILQLGHADVHAQRGAPQRQHTVVRPAQGFAGGRHADHRRQHGMRGAVVARFLGRHLHQGQQGAVRGFEQVLVQCAEQVFKALGKVAGLGVAQQLCQAQLPLAPGRRPGITQTFHGGRGGLHGHVGDLVQRLVRQQQRLDLGQKGPVAVAGLVGVDEQGLPAGQQDAQVFGRADDEALVGQQAAANAPQCERDGLTKRNGR